MKIENSIIKSLFIILIVNFIFFVPDLVNAIPFISVYNHQAPLGFYQGNITVTHLDAFINISKDFFNVEMTLNFYNSGNKTTVSLSFLQIPHSSIVYLNNQKCSLHTLNKLVFEKNEEKIIFIKYNQSLQGVNNDIFEFNPILLYNNMQSRNGLTTDYTIVLSFPEDSMINYSSLSYTNISSNSIIINETNKAFHGLVLKFLVRPSLDELINTPVKQYSITLPVEMYNDSAKVTERPALFSDNSPTKKKTLNLVAKIAVSLIFLIILFFVGVYYKMLKRSNNDVQQ